MLISLAERGRRRDESGFAMVVVIASILIMSILAVGALTLSSAQQKLARRDQDSSGSLQAAQSGVDDYLARLQADPNYWTKGNVDTANAAFTTPTSVPGAASGAKFTYSIDTSKIQSQGFMSLVATGYVKNRKRTLTVRLEKQSFLDYMYFTQFETLDPVAYSSPPSGCNKYNYTTPGQPTARTNPPCTNINFASTDTLKGPVYSQDKVLLDGSPKFTGTYRTGWNDPAGLLYGCVSSCSPSFAKGKGYAFINFPSTNSALRPYADPAVGGLGCLFAGPTNIVFDGVVGGVGKMTVTSPGTSSTKSTGACGMRNWSTPQQIPVPSGQVIWVDSRSGSCSSFPSGFPYPISADKNSSDNPAKLKPLCGNGDVYVQGWVKGQVTIGAVNNIFVTNHLRYVGTNTITTPASLATGVPTSSDPTSASSDSPAADVAGTDILGLAAANFVQVYHPLDSAQSDANNVSSSPYPLTNFLIEAAIVASSDSFIVPDWNKGPVLGVLSVKGAIIQQFRGPVATGGGSSLSTGYAKNYAYDDRLRTLNPPHLADLASSSWISVAQGEGAPR
jgi:type II secretory pathway pseudopilin PulG